MNLKELLAAINAKKKEVKDLATADKLEEAKTAKEELIKLQNKYDLLKDMEEEEQEEMEDQIKNGTAKPIGEKVKDKAKAFVNVLKAGLRKEAPAQEDVEILNMMKEGTDSDGGLTVPEDISTQIKQLRRSSDALEMLVNVEPVSTDKGSRVYEINADQVPFDNVDEAEEFPDAPTPTLKKITYAIKKKGGILKITRELLQDSAENILSYLKNWISKKAKATRNALILNTLNTMTAGKEVTITNVDGLKDIFNVKLDPAISVGASVLTNQDGFNWLDKLKDSDGKYILQPDPTKETKGLLFGKYPLKNVSNKVLKSTATFIPIYCGDFKEAITLYDRENLSIELSTEAGDLWGKDLTGIKVRERLDIQQIDDEAVIKAQVAATGE